MAYKIKRNRNIYGNYRRRRTVYILAVIAAVVALFFAGYFLYGPIQQFFQ